MSTLYVRVVEIVWSVRFDDMFDKAAYQTRHAEVALTGYDPVFHYLRYGAKKNFAPHPQFDTAFYLREYSDVAKSRINPLLHYLKFGRKEGRRSRSAFVFKISSFGLGGLTVSDSEFHNPDLATNRFSRPVKTSGTNPQVRRISFQIDEPVTLMTGEVVLHGWCFFDEGVLPRKIVGRICGVEMLAFLHQPMKDLEETVSDARVANSGFVFHLDGAASGNKLAVEAVLDGGQQIFLRDVKIPQSFGRLKMLRSPGDFRDYDDYVLWETRSISRVSAPDLPQSPRISLLLPTYNSNLYFLERCIDSIKRQRYPNWELCIVDDCSDSQEVRDYLLRVSNDERRVRLTFRDERGHISAALNTALELSSADYVALIDHDDELHEDALWEIAKLLNEKPGIRLVYTDEDKIDSSGRRTEPAFKLDFDMDALRSIDYFGHLICVERSLILSIAGFRDHCVGAQDWDLLLRIAERLDDPGQIGHVEKPLYHWRKHAASTAQSTDAKPYVRTAWKTVLQEQVNRMRIMADVEPGWLDGSMRLRFRAKRDVSVTLMVSDACSEGSLRGMLSPSMPFTVRLFDFSRPNISFPKPADGEVFVFVLRPIEFVNHWFLDELVANALRPDCAAVSPVIASSDGKILDAGLLVDAKGRLRNVFAGMPVDDMGYLGLSKVVHKTAAPSGICLAMRADLLCDGHSPFDAGSSHPEIALARFALSHVSKNKSMLVTPYAIATLPKKYSESLIPDLAQLQSAVANASSGKEDLLPRLNPNLDLFADPQAVWTGGIK